MFGLFSGRKKHVANAVEHVRRYVTIIQKNQGLPAGFWESEYVLGWFHTMIGMVLKFSSQGKLGSAELGFAVAETFEGVSGLSGTELVRRCSSLALHSPDFERGGDDAAAAILFGMGSLRAPSEHTLVVHAKRIVGQSGQTGEIVGAMILLSLGKEVEKLQELRD
ncbi:MAG: hypothetical protein ACK5WN_06510 [Alphaproteobacteria bacterium]|jgi:hypothetical protein|nr:hypothetical protein [Roseomonas sp.]